MIDFTAMATRALEQIGLAKYGGPRYIPKLEHLAEIMRVVFWSSLEKYEGDDLRVFVQFADAPALGSCLPLEHRKPFTILNVRQLAPACSREGALLATCSPESGLTLTAIVPASITGRRVYNNWVGVMSAGRGVVHVMSAGMTVLRFSSSGVELYDIHTFDSFSAAFMLSTSGVFTGCPAPYAIKAAESIVNIGNSINRLEKGGAIWILPARVLTPSELTSGYQVSNAGFDPWSVLRPIWERNGASPLPFGIGGPVEDWIMLNPWLQDSIQISEHVRIDSSITTIASLSGTDGAILMNGEPRVLRFGVVHNGFRPAPPTVKMITGPDYKSERTDVPVERLGGSRHRSAVQFCSSFGPSAAAIVVSHDGGMTIMISKDGCVEVARVRPNPFMVDSKSTVSPDRVLP